MKITKICKIYFVLFTCTYLSVGRGEGQDGSVQENGGGSLDGTVGSWDEDNQNFTVKDDSGQIKNQQLKKENSSGEEENQELSVEENGREETENTLEGSNTVTGACGGNPCGDRGLCTESGNENSSYSCMCERGWVEDENYKLPNCKKYDEVTCIDSLCDHGGKCPTNVGSSPNCECPNGYSGRWCEHGSDSKWVPSASSSYNTSSFFLVLLIFGYICAALMCCFCIASVLFRLPVGNIWGACACLGFILLAKKLIQVWKKCWRSEDGAPQNQFLPKIPGFNPSSFYQHQPQPPQQPFSKHEDKHSDSSSNEDEKEPLVRHKLPKKHRSKGTPVSSDDREISTTSTTKSKKHHSSRKRRDISEDEEKSVTKHKVAKDLGSDGTPSSSNDRQEFTASPSKPKKHHSNKKQKQRGKVLN